jgi:hypothetical protein
VDDREDQPQAAKRDVRGLEDVAEPVRRGLRIVGGARSAEDVVLKPALLTREADVLERVVEARAALLERAPDLRDSRKLGAPQVEQPVPLLLDAELRPLFSSPSVTAS